MGVAKATVLASEFGRVLATGFGIEPSLTVGLLPRMVVAYCLLLTAFCLLPTAYCGLGLPCLSFTSLAFPVR